MTMTTEKLAELKRLYAAMTNCDMYGEDGATKGMMVPQSLLDQFEAALAERALQPEEGQANLLPCPFCGQHLSSISEEVGYWRHPDNECLLSRAGFNIGGVNDMSGRWNSRALRPEKGGAQMHADEPENRASAGESAVLAQPEEGQALPVAWRFREYDAQEGKHSSVWFITQARADMEVYKRYGAIIEPLYASQLALPAAQQLIGAGHFTMDKSGRWAEVDRNAPNSTVLYHGPEWPQENAAPFSHEERMAADVKYQMMKTSYEAEIKQLRERLALPAGPVRPVAFDVELPHKEEENIAQWVGAEKWSPWVHSLMRLALLLNTTKRGLIDYQAAIHFANELVARTASPSPAVAQPVADERAAAILRDLVKLWDSQSVSEDDFNEEMVRIENAARAALFQPAEEGGKA